MRTLVAVSQNYSPDDDFNPSCPRDQTPLSTGHRGLALYGLGVSVRFSLRKAGQCFIRWMILKPVMQDAGDFPGHRAAARTC